MGKKVANDQGTGCVAVILAITTAAAPGALTLVSPPKHRGMVLRISWQLNPELIVANASHFEIQISTSNLFEHAKTAHVLVNISAAAVLLTSTTTTYSYLANLSADNVFDHKRNNISALPGENHAPLHMLVRFTRVRQFDGTVTNRGSNEWSPAHAGWKTARECQTNFLDTSHSDPYAWECCPCYPGSFCGGDATKADVIAKKGYFRIPKENYTNFTREISKPMEYNGEILPKCTRPPAFILCPYQERCLGFDMGESSHTTKPAYGAWLTRPEEYEACKNGTTGLMCALCAENWAREGSSCNKCTPDALGRKLGIFAGIVAFVVILAVVFRKAFKKFPRRLKKMKKDLFRILIIVMNFAQIGTSLPGVFNVEWPEGYLNLLSKFDIVNVNILELTGTTCAARITHTHKLLAMFCLPFLLVVYALVKYIVGRAKAARLVKASNAAKQDALWLAAAAQAFDVVDHEGDEALNAGELTELLSHMNVILDKEQAEALLIDWSDGAPVLFEDGTKELSRVAFLRSVRGPKGKKLIHRAERTKLISWTQNFKNISKAFASVGELMFAVHAPVSQTAFEWFWFVQLGDTFVMRADPRITRASPEWLASLPLAIFVLAVLTAGLPLVLGSYLYSHRQTLDSVVTLSRFGWMYDRYSPGVEWWGLHELFRKCVLTGLLIYIDAIEMRVACALFVSIVAILNLNYWSPFRNYVVFWVSQVAFCMTALKYVIAMFRLTIAHRGNADQYSELGTFLIVIELFTFSLFVVGAVLCVFYVTTEVKKSGGVDVDEAEEKLNRRGPRRSVASKQKKRKMFPHSAEELAMCIRQGIEDGKPDNHSSAMSISLRGGVGGSSEKAGMRRVHSRTAHRIVEEAETNRARAVSHLKRQHTEATQRLKMRIERQKSKGASGGTKDGGTKERGKTVWGQVAGGAGGRGGSDGLGKSRSSKIKPQAKLPVPLKISSRLPAPLSLAKEAEAKVNKLPEELNFDFMSVER
jgi:hypothetical protein